MLAREEWSIPKIQPESKPDVFSLESLIAWLEKQPADKEYCFLDTGGCLFYKYLSESGIAVASVAGDYYRATPGGAEIDLPKNFPEVAALRPHTFGAALDRARAALAVA